MTRTEILDELKLSKDFIIHECYETDKIIFVTVSKDASPSQITEGSDVSCYAKWKNETVSEIVKKYGLIFKEEYLK